MSLTGKDFAAALALVGTLQSSGSLLEGLSFDVAPETLRATEDELTAEALAGLHARAEKITAALKMNVVRYKTVDIGNAMTGGVPPMPRMMTVTVSKSAAAPPVQAEAGESTVSVTVQAQVIMAPAP
jgi:predicted secreted protein